LGSQSISKSKNNLGSQLISKSKNNLGSQSLSKSKNNLRLQKPNENEGSQVLSKTIDNVNNSTENKEENVKGNNNNNENTENNTEIIVAEAPTEEEGKKTEIEEKNSEEKKKDREVEEKLGNSIENTLKEIDYSVQKIEKKKKKKNEKKKTMISKNEKQTTEDDKKKSVEDEKSTTEDNNKTIEENDQSNESVSDGSQNESKTTEEDTIPKGKILFDDYGFSDSDIDFYDEPLIRDIMTPPITDENSTFTWIPQLSDYLENVKQELLIKAKQEQDELIKEKEEIQEEEEMENKSGEKSDETLEEKEKQEGEIENRDKNDEGEKKEEEKVEKGEVETKLEEENKVKEGEGEKKEEEKETLEGEITTTTKNNILTDNELLQEIEKSLDVSNIIDEPVLSFGMSRSNSYLKDDSIYEEEEEEEERKNEIFMNEAFEILRSETPINNEKIDEFADYFAKENNNEESQADLSDINHSEESINPFEEDDEENKSEKEEAEGEKKEEEEEEKEEESNGIDREEFIEKLKSEIEKYEHNSTKNLFLQTKLYELFRKKRPNEIRDGDKSLNDQEQRYLASMYEYKDLINEYDEINNKKQEISNMYKEKLLEKREESDKLYKEFYRQKQHIAQNAKSTRTGNEFSLKIFDQLEGLEKKKDEMITKARLENIRLQNKLHRQESLLRQKEELADGLHLIDFEQLKIENQTYNEKIEERNEELLKLRKKINNIVQVLTHVKEKLQFVQAENLHLKEELNELDGKVTKQRDTLPAIKQSRDKLRHNTQILRQRHGLLGNRILLMDFENKIDETENLKRQVEELQVYHTELMLKRLAYKRKIKKSHIILAGC
jgi:hypothetical protein